MRALVYHGPWSMSLEETPDPQPGPGEILVDVKAVGICGSDVHGYTGSTGRRTPGMVMGHEFSGVISALGDGVSAVEEEDEVVVSPLFPFDGKGVRRVVGVNVDGAYADRIVVHESMVVPKPPELSFRLAAMAEPLSVAMHAVSLTPIGLMENVAIVGAGTIGLLTAVAARLKGAGKIFITDMSEHRLDVARQIGVDMAINIKEQDPIEVIKAETDGWGVDCAIEAVGLTPAVQQAHSMTRNGGHVTWIGNSALMIEVNMQDVVTRELTVQGSYGFTTEFPVSIQALASGRIDVEPLIERIATLEEGPDYMDRLAKGELEMAKVIIEP